MIAVLIATGQMCGWKRESSEGVSGDRSHFSAVQRCLVHRWFRAAWSRNGPAGEGAQGSVSLSSEDAD